MSVVQTNMYYTGFSRILQVFLDRQYLSPPCTRVYLSEDQIDHICAQQNSQDQRNYLHKSLGHFPDAFFKKRLEDVEKDHASDSEAYTGI